jgi:hypothetical protein
MSESIFFVRGRNKGNERKVILSTATLLVGKAPTKSKRIKIKVRMPLNGKAGAPEWVTNAMVFVGQSHDIVSPQVEFSGFDIQFSDDNLFDEAKAKANKCQMRCFVIQEAGDSENLDIEMQFLIYAPFSTALWKWCGQMGGEDVWAQFTQVEQPEEDDEEFELSGEDQEEEEGEPEEAEAAGE